jgi:hypothetical protein
MDDFWTRVVDDMAARLTGPMPLRLLLQPIMASIFAIRPGLADAKAGRSPYFWALFSDPAHRADMVKDGWKSVGTVFVVALILDGIYQIVSTRFVYPGEAVTTALLLAIVPYLILRGLVTRLGGKKYRAARRI